MKHISHILIHLKNLSSMCSVNPNTDMTRKIRAKTLLSISSNGRTSPTKYNVGLSYSIHANTEKLVRTKM